MTEQPSFPPSLQDVTRDTWDACRHSLLYSGRLLDFLAFTVPSAVRAIDRVQLALDAVFDELHTLPSTIARGTTNDQVWTRDDLEEALDRLTAVSSWEHPSQVLGRPRPDDRQILALCEFLLVDVEPRRRQRLLNVRQKLERTVRIAEEARQKRQQMAGKAKKDAGD